MISHSQTDDEAMFGDSWLYDLDPQDEHCECKVPKTEPCSTESEQEGEELCETLKTNSAWQVGNWVL